MATYWPYNMEYETCTDKIKPKLVLPSLPASGAAPEEDQPLVGSDAHAATRRERDVRYTPYDKHDEGLEDLVSKVSSQDRGVASEAVVKLWELTVLTRRNRAANQIALAGLGGVVLIVDYATTRTTGATIEDEDEANMALLVLENLSTNVQLHHEMAHNGELLALLVAVTCKQRAMCAMRANAAKILVNLTFSSVHLQNIAVRAGALAAALVLLQESEPGLVRQGAWLLSHLTAGQGCAAREELGFQLDALKQLRDLLLGNEDRATRAHVCEVLCNLARGSAESHANLVQAGVVPVLLALTDTSTDRRQGPELVAPALLALAALATTSGSAVLRTSELQLQLVPYLAGILGYSNLVTRDYDLSRVLMAAHTLIFALGTFVVKDKSLTSTVASPDYVKELLQESGYVSFEQSLQVLGLEQPKYVAASLGKDLGGPHCFVANTTHQVNVELLPLLRQENTRMVTNACARLYQIATCLRDHPEGRLVLTNSSLVLAVRDLLDSEHSAVLQAALSLVDALACIPEVVPLLVGSGVMDAVNRLSDQQDPVVVAWDNNQITDSGTMMRGTEEPSAPASANQNEKKESAAMSAATDVSRDDPLVRLLAERALVTMFLAQEAEDGQSVS